MQKIAKILAPGSVDPRAMGHDIAEAAAANLAEDRRTDFIILNEGTFANVVQEIMNYHLLTSGGNRTIALRDTRNDAEKLGDDIAEDLSIADQLPTAPEDIPVDHAGLLGLLQIADKYPKVFDTALIEKWYNMLSPATHPPKDLAPVADPELLAQQLSEMEKKEQKETEKWEKHFQGREQWSSLAVKQGADAVASVRQEMIDSGLFTSEQRQAAFEDKLIDTYMAWQNLITDIKLQKEMAGEARENIREQKEGEEAKVQQSIEERTVGLEDMSPAMRAKVEERQAAEAKAKMQAEDDAKAAAERTMEFNVGTAPSETEIPGLDEFIRDLQVLTRRSPDEPPDEERIAKVHHYAEALKGAAKEHPEVPWETAAATLAKDFGLEAEFSELEDTVRQQREQREKAQEMRAPSKPPAETVPESQKAETEEELPPGISVTTALIRKHEEFDKTKGPWELDLEAKALRRRKLMVQNAVLGRPVLPYKVGDKVAFTRNTALVAGEIMDITQDTYVLKTDSGEVEVAHGSVFDPGFEGLF